MIAEPTLPYAVDALEPNMSAQAMREHLQAHRNYVDKCNDWLRGDGLGANLAAVEQAAVHQGRRDVADAASQAINHELFWQSMTPFYAPLDQTSKLAWLMGGVEHFRRAFVELASSQFGSGWLWIAQLQGNRPAMLLAPNAGRPPGQILLVADLWEHAWWTDYPNRRKRYAEVFFDKLADWRFAESRL